MFVNPRLSAKRARALAVRAQGLSGPKPAGIEDLARRIGAIQLDTISVLARSHELAAYARFGAMSRSKIEDAYWGRTVAGESKHFEYWSHAASILPIEHWPHYAFRRRANLTRDWSWFPENRKATEAVIERIRAEGPLTATQPTMRTAIRRLGARCSSCWCRWRWNRSLAAPQKC